MWPVKELDEAQHSVQCFIGRTYRLGTAGRWSSHSSAYAIYFGMYSWSL